MFRRGLRLAVRAEGKLPDVDLEAAVPRRQPQLGPTDRWRGPFEENLLLMLREALE